MGIFSALFGRSRSKFQEEVERQLRDAGDHRALKWSAEGELTVKILNQWPEGGVELALSEVFQRWSSSGNAEVISDVLASEAQQGAKTQPGFLPLLTGPTLVRIVELSEQSSVLQRTVTEGLRAALLFSDGPDDDGILTQSKLAKLGLSAEQAWAEALKEPSRFAEISPRVFAVAWPGAVVDWERQTPPPVFGEPLLVVLNRELMLFTGSQEPNALAIIAEVIQEHLAGGDEVLGHALVRRGDRWMPWLPPPTDPATRLFFVMMRRCSLREEYKAQAELLKRLYPQHFIASYMAEAKKGMTVLSIASWAKGVRALIPRSEVLSLSKSLTSVQAVRFEDVLEHLGHHLKPVEGVYPPRWRVETFPSDEELAALPEGLAPNEQLWWFEDDDGGPKVEVTPNYASLTRPQFVEVALQVLAQLGAKNMEYSDEGFGVRVPLPKGPQLEGVLEGAPEWAHDPQTQAHFQIGFSTPFARYQHVPRGELRAHLTEYFQQVLDPHSTPRVDRDQVLPLLRPRRGSWQGL